MAVKKSGAGTTKNKKRKLTKVTVPVYVLPDDVNMVVPILREALICANDNNTLWGKTGMASSALPKYAKAAAWLCRGKKCFFCGSAQEPIPQEKVFDFHPKYPLCQCLTPYRIKAQTFDHVENWETPEGAQQILASLDSGKVAPEAPVYQYYCQGIVLDPAGKERQCRAGPVIVDYRTVAYGLRKNFKHPRRRLCPKCHQVATAKRNQLTRAMSAEAMKAKQGPAARINRVKYTRKAPPAIPPQSQELNDKQLAELDRKALEKITQAKDLGAGIPPLPPLSEMLSDVELDKKALEKVKHL